MKLPPYLIRALEAIVQNGGEDIGYAMADWSRETALSYMSRLKALGLAYTYEKERGHLEVWATRKGSDIIKELRKERGD